MSSSQGAKSVTNVYIAEGFMEDCATLIYKFLQSDSLNYQVFCKIWKDMKFGYIFHGRMSIAEIVEYTEEVIFIARKFMVAPTNTFEESVAGLFILYGVLNLQPFKNFICVRFIPEDVDAILKIKEVALKKERYDVLYMLGSLLIIGPSEYHIAERPYGFEKQIRKYLEAPVNIDKVRCRKGVLYRHNDELDLLRQLSNVSRRYVHAKNMLDGERDKSLNYLDENLANNLAVSLKALIENGEIPSEGEPPEEEQSRVWEIKHRAMKNTVKHIDYLSGANERIEQDKPDECNTKNETVTNATKKMKKFPQKKLAGLAALTKKTRQKRKRLKKTNKSDSSSSDTDGTETTKSKQDVEDTLEPDGKDNRLLDVMVNNTPKGKVKNAKASNVKSQPKKSSPRKGSPKKKKAKVNPIDKSADVKLKHIFEHGNGGTSDTVQRKLSKRKKLLMSPQKKFHMF